MEPCRIAPVGPRLVVAMMAAVLIGTPSLTGAAALPGGVRAVGVVTAAALTVVALVRGLGVALHVTDEGLKVGNFRSTVTIPWDQVVRIDLAGSIAPSSFGVNSCVAIELRNGTRVKSLATMAPGRAQARRISEVLRRAGELHGVPIGLQDWQ